MVQAGQTLRGKYRVEAALGQGGMATVWQGVHVATGRRIAIKVLDDRFLGSANVVERFGREARAASSIHHESIVEVLDLDRTDEGAPFLVMELLQGETLTRRIEKRGRLSASEIVAIADPLLDALHAAHEAGVVHRDLKPDNIMLVPAGRRGEKVKVLDFGISSKSDEVSSLTTTGSLLGTPHYMSPEQARGRTDIDRRADLYAMGVVLYECAVGEVPFDAENYNALIQEILNAEPVSPRARGAEISPAVEAVVLRAMSKNRDARPSTAEALRDELVAVAPPPLPTASSSGSFPAAGSGSYPVAVERKSMPTIDADAIELEIEPVRISPSPPRPIELEPIRASSSPPRPRNLQLDGAAVRRISQRRDAARDHATPTQWGRIALVSVLAIAVLIAVVRFVVHPMITSARATTTGTP